MGPAYFGHQMAVKFEVKLHVTPLKNQEIISRTIVGVSKLSDFLVTTKVIEVSDIWVTGKVSIRPFLRQFDHVLAF